MKDERTEYKKLSDYLRQYEENKPWKEKDISWICDRIDWAWHWKKISRIQMEELTDRACFILNGTMDEYIMLNGNKER